MMMRFLSRDLTKKLKNNPESWECWADLYYSMAYSMYDKTPAERRWLRRLWKVLHKNLPKGWENSVTYLQFKGCMGESVYCVDGVLDHTIHSYHETCRDDAVLRRGEGLWCAKCNCEVNHKEIMMPGELNALKTQESYKEIGLENLDLQELSYFWESVSLGYFEDSRLKHTKEVMQELYDALIAIAPKEGVLRLNRGYIVNGRPAIRLCRDCSKCNIEWHKIEDCNGVYDIWQDGPYAKRKVWCAKCNNWSKLTKM